MVRCFLGMGSNAGRELNLRTGMIGLRRLVKVCCVSSVYESEAVGFAGNPFYNLVVEVETILPLASLSAQLKTLEDSCGRVRGGPRYAPRTLDIDILTYADWVGVFDGIELPRDEVLTQAFVLWPLAEVAPEICHPTVGKTYARLWEEYDKHSQQLAPVPFSW